MVTRINQPAALVHATYSINVVFLAITKAAGPLLVALLQKAVAMDWAVWRLAENRLRLVR
jgi:hypothetical protein